MKDSEYVIQQVKAWSLKGDNDLMAAEILVKANDFPADSVCFHCSRLLKNI